MSKQPRTPPGRIYQGKRRGFWTSAARKRLKYSAKVHSVYVHGIIESFRDTYGTYHPGDIGVKLPAPSVIADKRVSDQCEEPREAAARLSQHHLGVE
jgi:hypothetical protein